MLTEKEMNKLAQPICIEMLGKDFVEKRKDLCMACWGYQFNDDEYVYSYTVLVNEEEEPKNADEFDYSASVYVDDKTGEVTKDLKNSRLPSKEDKRICR